MAKDDNETAKEGAEKLPYPKSIIFIIGTEFCERSNYYGMRTILSLYLSRALEFTRDQSTMIFHSFVMLNYGFCIAGAIISDNWLGKFNTIFAFSLVYVCGSISITLGAVPPLHLPSVWFCLGGLVLIGLGSGGIKPCVSAFGGDQFQLPQQHKYMTTFFSMFYFTVNAGALISTALTPILRADVRCFGDLTCYSLAFGVPAILMLTAFDLCRPWYIINPPASGNMVVEVTKSIGHAIVQKCKSKEKREHWMDYADDKYDKELIKDVKAFMRIVVVYIPVPLFFALFDQQGSRWTFQAARMNGEMGSFRIKPDQMLICDPILVLLFIPLCDIAIYPALKLIGIKRPLQKMVLGGTLCGLAFTISSIVEFQLEKTYPTLPADGNAQLRIFNSEACDYDVITNIEGQEKFTLKAFDAYTYKDIDVPNEKFELTYDITSADAACPTFTTKPISISEKTAHTIFLSSKNTKKPISDFVDNVDKPVKGFPYGRILANIEGDHNISWIDDTGEVNTHEPNEITGIIELSFGMHKIAIDDQEIMEIFMHAGSSYTIVIHKKADGTYATKVHEITQANSMHILWQLPQYISIALGEVMFCITSLAFTYSQAPVNMKSVAQAISHMAKAFGNIIVVVIAFVRYFRQAFEFLLFSTLMYLDMIFLAYLAYRYKPNDPNKT